MNDARARSGMSRRAMLHSGCGLGAVALAVLAGEQAAAESPLRARAPHFAPRARRVIFLCMRGGPSQVETFDYKPRLQADHGQSSHTPGNQWFASQWGFRQYGASGQWVSDLLPHLARRADELCVLCGMTADSSEHAAALTQLHTGSIQFERPSIGSWVLYGLGTENQDLPGFLSISPPTILGGARTYGSAFLPSAYQGLPLGEMNRPVAEARIENLRHPRLSALGAERQLALLQALQRRQAAERPHDAELEGVIESYELAFRMQAELPRVLDLSRESQATLDEYGIVGKAPTADFGRQCLLARRAIEAGVRFVELTHDNWDHHASVARLMPLRCQQIDQPIAALLADLKRRGLLDETLVVWGGEFGRLPDDPRGSGRGHNPHGFTCWLAGGGVRPGLRHGATDDYGARAVEGQVHVHDLHATILHLLGLDHERLTYRYAGRDFRLTDVAGRVVREVLS